MSLTFSSQSINFFFWIFGYGWKNQGLFLVTKGDSEHVQYVRLMGFEKNKGLNIKLHSIYQVFKNSILNYLVYIKY